MDDVDKAALEIDRQLNQLILMREKPKTIESTGFCLNCGEALVIGKEPHPRWCDSDCRDDWERRQ